MPLDKQCGFQPLFYENHEFKGTKVWANEWSRPQNDLTLSTIYIYIYLLVYVPVVPQKAVAEVSKIGNL